MRFEITSLGDHLPDPHSGQYNETQAQRFATIVEMGVRAEKLGYAAFWLGEHHASDYILSSPQMLLAAVAVRTKHIRLGSAVSLLPNNDPVRLAEDFATLDLLSEGRAEIGFGGGITEHTFQLFGQQVEDAAAISVENLDLIQKLWNEKELNWTGKFRTPIAATTLEPRTYSGKALPIFRACGSENTARLAGASGQKAGMLNVISGFTKAKPVIAAYREAYRKSGHNPAGMDMAGTGFAFVRADGAKAREQFLPYLNTYMGFTQMLLMSKGMSRSLIDLAQSLGEGFFEAGEEARFVGEPSEVIEKIHRANELAGGLDAMQLVIDVGGLPREEIFATMDLFAEKVIPKI